ncbi:hypothetical protein BY996DRAFT_6479333 [Phakopsora pachyrhizi]|nr:hypothetical protein BY996DRAFT_6479333 [Phakopsora pachyrhizi]
MSYTDALVILPVTNQENKGIITKLYDFYKTCLETEPGEEEHEVPSAIDLCSVPPHLKIEECPISTTQATEIEAPSDSVSRTLKHKISHQSIQNPLPPPKCILKDFNLFQKHKLGE